MITVREFIAEAKTILAKPLPLAQKQIEIAHVLSDLSRRDDLMRLAVPFSVVDTCPATYMLWREPPNIGLFIGWWPQGYISAVHEHANYWVVGSVIRGCDRWDMYERRDDGSRPGYSDVRQIDTIVMEPHKWAIMPTPPRAIHAHNNVAPGETLELLFSAADRLPPEQRLFYDVEGHTHWPSGFNISSAISGERYPPAPAYTRSGIVSEFAQAAKRMSTRIKLPQFGCPICPLFTPAF